MLTIGQPLPDFELPNQDGKTVRLSDYRGRRLVLFSFPKADSLGCNMQACSFRDDYAALTDKGIAVLGISADTQDELRRWKEKKRLPYDLLSDPRHTVLDSYGGWGLDVFGVIKLPGVKRYSWAVDEHGALVAHTLILNPVENVAWALRVLGAEAKVPSAG